MERAYGCFERSIPLPRHVDAERAEASFRNGVLTVRLPKAGNASPKKIEIC
jgi:HSP20 family protein